MTKKELKICDEELRQLHCYCFLGNSWDQTKKLYLISLDGDGVVKVGIDGGFGYCRGVGVGTYREQGVESIDSFAICQQNAAHASIMRCTVCGSDKNTLIQLKLELETGTRTFYLGVSMLGRTIRETGVIRQNKTE